MKLILIACEGLRPHIEKLRENENAEADVLYYPAQNIKAEGFLQNIINDLDKKHAGGATVVFAAGKDNLPEEKLDFGNLCTVFPLVHSFTALLLGSPERYRAVVEECEDYPLFSAKSFLECGENEALNFIKKGHTAAVLLTDETTTLEELEQARNQAQAKNITYREYMINNALLKEVLSGSYGSEIFSSTQPVWQ